MMRQDNLLQERMYHIVIKEQRSFSCSVFAIRVLTLPNQTKVNSAEPKLQVLISSYIHMYIRSIFVIKNIGKQFTVNLQRFHHVQSLQISWQKLSAVERQLLSAFLAVSCHTYCSDQIVRYKEQYRHVGKTDRTLRSKRFLTSEAVVLVRATESAQPINTWD